MTKEIILYIVLIFSYPLSGSSLINLKCTTQTQNSDRGISFDLLIGTETKKAIQILKKGQLKMDLSVSDKYFKLGQFTDESKKDFITVLRVNRETLEIDYAKYMDLIEPVLCKHK